MGLAREKAAEMALARANIYGLLAPIFRAEPDEALLTQLKDPGFSGALEALGLSLGKDFEKTPLPTLIEDLAIEYTRLFIGPGPHLSPHESVHVDVDGDSGGLWGAKTVAVKKFIESAGFDYEDQFTGMPDHISVELEFMGKLAEFEAEKWAEGDEDLARYGQSIQRKFMEDHIMNWIPAFCDQVVHMAENPFFGEIAKVTKSFLEFDGEEIATQTANAA